MLEVLFVGFIFLSEHAFVIQLHVKNLPSVTQINAAASSQIPFRNDLVLFSILIYVLFSNEALPVLHCLLKIYHWD